MLRMVIDGDEIDIRFMGRTEEILAEWAAATVRLERYIKHKKGIDDPEELLRVALSAAERKGRN